VAVATALGTLSFLLRPHAFLAGLILSLPLLAARAPRLRAQPLKARPWFLAILATGIIGAAAGSAVRPSADESDGWRRFREFHLPSVVVHDYLRPVHDASTAPVFQAAGWTPNDLALFREWYYLDGDTYSPGRLRFIARNLWTSSLRDPFAKLRAQFKDALGIHARTLLVWIAVLAILQSPRRRRLYLVQCAWTLLVLAGLAALLKLPGYLLDPALTSLAWLGVLGYEAPPWKGARMALLSALLAAAVASWVPLFREVRQQQQVSRMVEGMVKRSLLEMGPRPDDLFVFWDSIFPYEKIRAFDDFECLRPFRLFCLTIHQRTPLAQRMLAKFGVTDLPRALSEDRRVRVLANRSQLEAYRRMSLERWGAPVKAEVTYDGPLLNIYRLYHPRP
jgi:hypothetical protein